MNFHPNFDPAGVPDDVLADIRAGVPLVARFRLKKDGQVYEPGEEVILGSGPNDHALCVPHGAELARVTTKARYEGQAAYRDQLKYNRDQLVPAEAAASQAAVKEAQAAAKIARLEDELKAARAAHKTAQKDNKLAQAALQDVLAAVPVL